MTLKFSLILAICALVLYALIILQPLLAVIGLIAIIAGVLHLTSYEYIDEDDDKKSPPN